MAAARNYSSVARATTLTGAVNGSVTVFPVSDTTGFPTAPFTMVADPGRSTEEIVTVTAVVGLNLTVVRGEDGSSAQPHDAGADVRHMATARDYREAGVHVGAVSGVHGVSGAIVGTTDTQSVDNKTFVALAGDHTALKVKQATGQGSALLIFSDSANATIASVGSTGRVSTPGVDSTSSSTFTTTTPATAVTVIKGAPVQTGALTSWRDATSTELAFISPAGALNAPSVVAGTITTPRIDAAQVNANQVNGSGQSNYTTTISSETPLTIKTPPVHSGYSLAVRDSSNAIKGGFAGDNNDFRLFQSGGDYVPWKIHCGTKSVTMGAGTSSISSSVDISGYGFTQNPLVMLTVRQFEASTLKRRVCVNNNGITTSSIAFRVVQTANEQLPDDEPYTVHWMAMQMSPDAAAG